MEKGRSAPTLPIAADVPLEVATESASNRADAASMIVVLAKNASSVRSTVLFLERRGLSARILSSLNEAVELFSKKQANKLLLSVNFPHPKVEMLPVLMNQSFQIETILFAEENDRRSQQRLSSAKTKHVLFGPASGPVVMMKIRQIERELAGGESGESSSSSARSSNDKGDESLIKGGGSKLDDDMYLSSGGDLQRSGDLIVQKGWQSKMKSQVQEGIDSDDGGFVSEQGLALRRGLDRGLKAVPTGGGRRRLMNLAGPLRARNNQPSLGPPSDAQRSAINEDEVKKRCLREALAIVAGSPTALGGQLAKHNFAALISLRSASLNWSFVVSLNFSKQLPSEIFQTIEVAFFSLLRDHGFEFNEVETHSIVLDDMAIVENAFAFSEFTAVTQALDIEMGVARVHAENPVAVMVPYEENMLSVSLRDLPANVPIAFSVYLHFERNQKYIRFLKIGSKISEPQMGRLERRHPEVLVEHKDSEVYRRYFAAHAIRTPKRRAS